MPPVGWCFEPVGEPPPQQIYWDQWLPMVPQAYDWTCSACSLDWVLTATLTRESDRYLTTMEIGYTHNINPSWGLMNADGSQLQRVLADYGYKSEQSWLDFDTVYHLAANTPVLMGGDEWNHWVAVRGVQGNGLWLANSAPGYRGIYDYLDRRSFEQLGGFSVVWLVEE